MKYWYKICKSTKWITFVKKLNSWKKQVLRICFISGKRYMMSLKLLIYRKFKGFTRRKRSFHIWTVMKTTKMAFWSLEAVGLERLLCFCQWLGKKWSRKKSKVETLNSKTIRLLTNKSQISTKPRHFQHPALVNLQNLKPPRNIRFLKNSAWLIQPAFNKTDPDKLT